MFVKLAAVAAAVIAPLAFATPAAHAGEHSGDCDPSRHINYCPSPPQPSPQGYNLILGSRGNDTIFGTHGADSIFGFRGDDRLITNGGADILFGGRDNDTLVDNQPAFFGNVVTLRGGSGTDLCIGTTNDVFRSCETVIVLP